MDDEPESLFYLGVGPLAAILLGMALVPFRGVTTASNFTFLFLVLTIAVAEFGGRAAAVGTALCSALSLDFFLTEPYLRLSIADKHDIIAFVGLAVCGLTAAVLGALRGERNLALVRARKQRDLARSILREWDPAAPVEPQLNGFLRAIRDAYPLAGAALRTPQNTVLASSGQGDGLRPVPQAVLEPETLLVRGASLSGHALPSSGGRLALRAGSRSLGWLDLWGNGVSAGQETRQALSDLARLLGALLIAGERPSARS